MSDAQTVMLSIRQKTHDLVNDFYKCFNELNGSKTEKLNCIATEIRELLSQNNAMESPYLNQALISLEQFIDESCSDVDKTVLNVCNCCELENCK